jgi:hypothetical protein
MDRRAASIFDVTCPSRRLHGHVPISEWPNNRPESGMGHYSLKRIAVVNRAQLHV